MRKPPFELTEPLLDSCMAISRLLGQYEGIKLPKPKPMLIRRNRIKTIQSSLEIEGNRLTEDQVTAILDNKRVIGPEKDIHEVQNAIKAYEKLLAYKPNQLSSLLESHKIMMQGIIPDAGRLRSTNVGILKGSHVSHVAPKPLLVPELMRNLFSFIKNDKKVHALIKSCIFHYEFEFIHPFSDGNGRIGRLWQSVLLFNYHPVFEFTPIESLIKEKQRAYYKALVTSDKKGRSTDFIFFMIKTIRESLETFLSELQPDPETPDSRLQNARDHFRKASFTRKDYVQFQKTISTATASRDLSRAVKQGLLKKTGDKALARYRFPH
jgi:Fic family protein